MRKFKPWGKDGYIVTCNIKELTNIRGGSRNFKTGGRGRIPRSGVCFDAHSHILYAFVVRVVNHIHIVNIVY